MKFVSLNFKNILEPLINESPDDNKKPEISNEELSKKINQILECADAYDLDGLDNLMKELSSVKLPLDFSEIFGKIRKSVENVDFKEVQNLLTEWSSK